MLKKKQFSKPLNSVSSVNSRKKCKWKVLYLEGMQKWVLLGIWEETVETVWISFKFSSAIKGSEIQEKKLHLQKSKRQSTCSIAADRGTGVVKGLNKGPDSKIGRTKRKKRNSGYFAREKVMDHCVRIFVSAFVPSANVVVCWDCNTLPLGSVPRTIWIS